MAKRIQLKKFDLSKLEDNATILVVGRRRTGKTTLVTDLMYHKRHIPMCMVMSGSEMGNGHYSHYVPDTMVYTSYDPAALERLIGLQKRKKADGTSCNVLLLCDDLAFDTRVRRDQNVSELMANGRHLDICFVNIVQFLTALHPSHRQNIDKVFCFREASRNAREALYKNFFGMFPSFAEFCEVFEQTTQGYDAMVVDNTNTSSRISDCVYWYRATVRPPGTFRIGCPALWRMNQRIARRRKVADDDTEAKRARVVKVGDAPHG